MMQPRDGPRRSLWMTGDGSRHMVLAEQGQHERGDRGRLGKEPANRARIVRLGGAVRPGT
jgi:hypothetical protein